MIAAVIPQKPRWVWMHRGVALGFSFRPADVVGHDLFVYRLLKRQLDGDLLRGLIVRTEAYSKADFVCYGYRDRPALRESLFGDSGWF